LAVFAALLLFATFGFAQSSKFAATYDTDELWGSVTIAGTGSGSVTLGEAEVASLHVANWKEIYGEMSAQINLITLTESKAANKAGAATTIAEGMVRGGMLVVPEGSGLGCTDAWADETLFAAPGPITFAARHQELSVAVDLDVVSVVDPNAYIIGDVTVALDLETSGAHSFQFIAEDMTSGYYRIFACYDLSAVAQSLDADSSAYSKTLLGPRILTVQEVRATKDGIIDETGVN